jgi:hypothetical protein
MPPVGFKPTISAGEWPKTYALDSAGTRTGIDNTMHILNSHKKKAHTVERFYIHKEAPTENQLND